MDIFRVCPPGDFSFPGILQDSLQPGNDFIRVFRGNDPLLAQHGSMSDGSCNILFKQALVKGNA